MKTKRKMRLLIECDETMVGSIIATTLDAGKAHIVDVTVVAEAVPHTTNQKKQGTSVFEALRRIRAESGVNELTTAELLDGLGRFGLKASSMGWAVRKGWLIRGTKFPGGPRTGYVYKFGKDVK